MGEPWFGAKDYGIGLSPKSRAGWLSLVVYFFGMAGAPPIARHFEAPRSVIPLVLGALTIAFLALMLISWFSPLLRRYMPQRLLSKYEPF